MARQEKRDAAYSISPGYWSHEDPQSGLGQIWPARVGFPIELEPCDVTSQQIELDYYARGTKVTDAPFDYYRDSTYNGTTRQLDNRDWIKGKSPIYGDDPDAAMRLADEIRQALGPLGQAMRDKYEHDNRVYLSAAELEDNDKWTAQQWRPPGFFLQSAITDAEVPPMGEFQRKWIKMVVQQRYGKTLRTLDLPKDMKSLIMLDDDPPDTMTGAPTYASGDRTYEARAAQLRAMPVPNIPPDEWFLRLRAIGEKWGLPEPILWSPVLALRHGPLKKPVYLWVRTDGGYYARYKATGAYDRSRFVYPIPYYINFLLSPLYVQLSGVRKHTLGLWHDPEHQALYIDKLRSQGGKPYTIDFSGMDTGMFKHVVLEFIDALLDAGFCEWPLRLFKEMYPEMGLVFPHFYGEPHSVSIITGDATPWMSGFKLTSEMDTLYGMTVLLSCMSLQIPDIFDRWIKGDWIFLELGDDIMFTLRDVIDPQKLADDALRLWGAKLKILDDVMFLKWLIPVVPEVPKLTRTFARFIQQTFYNEDRYDGIEGGARPGSIMRMGLYARMQSLNDHPDFNLWWPQLWPILSKVRYIAEASDAYRATLSKGESCLDTGDLEDIQAYAVRCPDYFLKLRDRAKYEPSAAALLREVSEMGVQLDFDPVTQQMRQVLLDCLYKEPDEHDYQVVAEYLAPYMNF